ncbi:carbohydrate kinase family protein [Chelativorans sp. YIM 93263]|uniref:carbohydrate kinase family protein n=1 Tax=Chelativorans sp. YIM 93263 TaxID=2906648 RepID=UPI0023789DFB|nr:carbohydrate kinase family protein [Chelativorans sp. YIM 93263]
MAEPHLLAVGGAHIDRRGRVHGPYVAEASNPGSMSEEVGGAVLNAARMAVQRGLSVSLFSLRGGDAAGQKVAETIEETGIDDLSATFLDRTTPSYTAILSQNGDLVTGLADMHLYELGFAKQLQRRKLREAFANSDAVLCDANMPAEALQQLAVLAENKPVYAIAISPAKVVRLELVLGSLAVLFMNRREARRLAGLEAERPIEEAVRILREKGLRAGVITAGDAPALMFDNEGYTEIAPPKVHNVADVTGAGDALAGASVAALMRGFTLAEAVREGMAAAKLVVESDRAAPRVGSRTFGDALASVPPINNHP